MEHVEDEYEIEIEDDPDSRNFIAHSRLGMSKDRSRFHPLSEKNIDLIQRYLENPTKCGVWTLKGVWHKEEGISKDIIEELRKKFVKKETVIYSGEREIILNLTEEDKKNLLYNVRRITFIFNLFTYFYHSEKKTLETFYPYLEANCPRDKLIFEIIDTKKIHEKYLEAFNLFKEKIYFDGFYPRVFLGGITQIKDGFFLLSDSVQRSSRLEIFSLKSDVLENLNLFFHKLGNISNDFLRPIFSPEEVVFEPYFSFLDQAYKYFSFTDNAKKQLRRSISEYSDTNYSYCVSTIGLIGEELITEIYETIFRAICPKNKTLGQTYSLIHDKIKEVLNIPTKTKPNVTPIFEDIKTIEKKIEKDEKIPFFKEIIKILRDIINHIKEDKTHTCDLINTSKKNIQLTSIFPSQIRENIGELIDYRNATAHKTKIPISNYAALRTIYCYISLYMWWLNEQKQIDWKEDEESIMKKIIERNNNTPLN